MVARRLPDPVLADDGLAPPPPRARWRGLAWPLVPCAVLLVAGSIAVPWYLQREAVAQRETTSLDDAAQLARTVIQVRNFYSTEIVPRARDAGLPVTHAWREQPGALPLPATFTIDLGAYFARTGDGVRMQLYSADPFPWRAGTQRLDAFQREAVATLGADPSRPFHRVETIDGTPTLRYAIADRMLANCVECHNRYPGSPRTDWKVGDVRGVLEIRRSLAAGEQRMRDGLRNALVASIGVAAGGLLLVGLGFRSLRASTRAAERQSAERQSANLRLQREVARRTEIESTLRLREETLRATFDGMHDGVVVFDRDGRILQSNRVAARLFGHEPDALAGGSIRALLPDDPALPGARHPDAGDGSVDGGGTDDGGGSDGSGGARRRGLGRRRDGSRFEVDVAVSALRLGETPCFAAVIADATAQARDERELAAARDAALDSVRVKSQFLANMSHEIRTPMNGVIGMTGLLRDTPLSAAQREMVDTVQRSADALLTIIDDILDLSRIEAGKLRLQHADFDPLETIEDTLELVADRAAAKGLRLGYRIDGAVPRGLHGDEVRFRQVLNNLVGNAVKFTSAGCVEVVLAFREESRLFEVRVRDTGPGIPQDKVRDLFQPFSQVDGSATRRFGGTGLGLAISRELVELMGGSIGVSTREGQGSLFHFTVAWRPPVAPERLRDPLLRLAGRRLVAVGLDPLQRAQLLAWGVDVHDAPPDASAEAARHGPVALVDASVAQAPGIARRIGAAGTVRVALVDRRPAETTDGVAWIAWPLRARALAALLDGGSVGVASSVDGGASDGAGRAGASGQSGASGASDAPDASDVSDAPPTAAALRDAAPPSDKAAVATARDRSRSSDASTDGAPPRPRHEALVVEDNPINQMLATALLARLGLAATVVDNGERALERMAERRWDVVLMDCQMPVMDGFEATRRWRAIEAERGLPRTPVVALTANAMEGDRERCLDAGMDDYLSKPVDRAALAALLASWLA
jgi:signal transduction histidine kinase/CheY-like chemotaxis protein/uncharacterized membrane protein YgcG